MVEGRKANLKYYVDQKRSMRSAGKMIGAAFKQVCDNYERLCTENRSPAAMYAFFEFLEDGETFGFKPDFDRALRYLNMAADSGHAEAHMILAKIHSDTHWRSYPGVMTDLVLSFGHTEKASLCSGWDGHKGRVGPDGHLLTDLVAGYEAHYALHEAFSSGLFHGTAGVVAADEEKAMCRLIQAAEGGHKEAQYDLYAHFHASGEVEKAKSWLLKAAAPSAWMYENGEKDYPWVEIQ